MKQTNRKADLPLLLLAVVLIFLIVCPVGMIFAKAVMQNGRLDFSPAVQTLLNPENAHMIGNSLLWVCWWCAVYSDCRTAGLSVLPDKVCPLPCL